MSELLRRGFRAETDEVSDEHAIRILDADSYTRSVQVRTVHISPWYVRLSNFFGERSSQITIYVLLGNERLNNIRFFVAKNRDLADDVRLPKNTSTYGFIDLTSLEKYEDSWDVLKEGKS